MTTTKPATLRQYLVLGIYGASCGRFAASYAAATPEEAEALALAEYDPEGHNALEIAGTVTIDDAGDLIVAS